MLGRQISIRVTPAEMKRLQREASSRSVTVSNYIRRAIYEHLSGGFELPEALFTEEATEARVRTCGRGEGTGQSVPEGSVAVRPSAHGALAFARRDEHIAAAIQGQAERISVLREEVRVLSAMVDRSYFGLITHMPEIDVSVREAAVMSGRRRYRLWRSAVEDFHKARGSRGILSPLVDAAADVQNVEGDDDGTE